MPMTFPFTDVDGSPLILEMDIDITEQKQMQKMLGEINETLEQRVAERTEQLKEANKELERFSYTVSHDLQAPLRAIKGFSQMIQKDEERERDAETKRKLVVIQENAERMQQLIDDLLALSRVGREKVSLQPIDMNAPGEGCLGRTQGSLPREAFGFENEGPSACLWRSDI